MNAVPNNFLGLPGRYSRYETARFAVLPVPYDSTTSFQTGTRNGPAAILEASKQVELFDEELEAECHRSGVATLDAVMPNMAGPAAMHEELFKFARKIVRDGKFLLALGGEHGISSALVRAVLSRHKKLSVLQIDAHCDLRDSYEGTPYSHACVMRRVLDLGASIVPVGIRNVSAEEHRFLKGKRIPLVTARECQMDDTWIDRVLDALGDTVYVTVDVDGFDPAFAPGTGTPEPGGLHWFDVTALLRLVCAEKNVVGADVVEVMPIPGQAVTEFLAARLAYKIIAYVSTRGG
jgi:agmatinase